MGPPVETGMILRLGHCVFIFLSILLLGWSLALDVNVSIKVPVAANEETPAITAETFVAALPPIFSVLAVVEATKVMTQLSICPPGYFCSTKGSLPEPCPLGTYYPLPGAQNVSQCEICPPGRVCGVGTAEPLNCSAGTFREQEGGESLQTDCYDCYVGSYCVSGSVTPVACVSGTVRSTPGGSGPSSCSPCPTGYWCGENTSVPTACPVGTFRNETGGTSVASCESCLPGSYCLEGFSTPTPCPSGTYCNVSGATECLPCTIGNVCPSGTVTPVPCNSGTFRNETGGGSQGDCSLCIIGHYCLNGGIVPEECAIGTHQTALGATTCDLCIPGEYQADTAMNFCDTCGAGTYLTGSGMTSISDCVACSTGSYQTGFGMPSPSNCTPCAGNSYCPTPTTVFPCPDFSHSPNGTSVVTSCVCDLGYEGPNGGPCTICNTSVWCRSGTPNVCPQNSLVNSPGGGALSDCMCVGGFFGYAMNTLGVPCAVCQENSYCEGGAANLTLKCPYGEYSPSGAEGVSACFCPGNASSGPGATNFDMCTCNPRFKRIANYSFSLTGWECASCGPNEVCYNDTRVNCPAHSHSAVAVTFYDECLCNPGYYHGSHPEYDLFCTQCDANYYCTGGSTKLQCNALMVAPPQSVNVSACYCVDGYVGIGNDTCEPCPEGFYCTLGDAFQCPSFSTSALQSTTLSACQCLPGYWGPNGGSCRACLPGTTKQFTGCTNCSNQFPMDCSSCPTGSYSNVTANGAPCDLCPPGKYLDVTGSMFLAACKPCTTGTYQTGWGLAACQYCGTGTYGSGVGMISLGNCSNCSVGTYQTGIGMPICSNCNPGSYSVQSGVTVCSLCNAGTFSGVSAATTPSVCTACAYGFYAASGASSCAECPFFSTTSTMGSVASSQCLCKSGYYGNCSDAPVTPQGLIGYYQFNPVNFLADSTGISGPFVPQGSGTPPYSSSAPVSSSFGSVTMGSSTGFLKTPYFTSTTGSVSWCLWMQYRVGLGMYQGVYHMGPAGSSKFIYVQWQTGYVYYTGSTSGSLPVFSTNQWFHVCNVVSGTTYLLYINGVLNLQGSNLFSWQNEQLTLTLGKIAYVGGAVTSSAFSEVMIFTSALTAAHVPVIYSGKLSCSACTTNFYCPGGQVNLQVPCPNSTYSLPAAPSVDQCVCPASASWIQGLNCTCNPGFYRVSNAFSLGGWQCNTCPANSYCYQGALTTCPLNSASLASSSLVSHCNGCLTGYEQVSVANCTACLLGYYCPDMTTQIVCPAGSYCPFLATAPTSCAIGYYSSSTGASVCTICPGGYACSGGTVTPVQCVVPQYAAAGSSVCTNCAANTYITVAGASACIACPTNEQSTVGSAGCVCNPGYYGPAYYGAIGRTGGFNVTQYTADNVNYSVTTFLSSGTIAFRVPTLVDVLIVGGGGGGGWNAGGGGGGGGVIYQGSVMVPAGTYQVTVGSGGLGGNYSLYTLNLLNLTNGGASSLFGATANGGGGGACFIDKSLAGNPGGSGGGGAPLAGLGGISVPGTVTGTILTAPVITGYAGAAASTTVGGGGGGASGVGQTSDGGVGYATTIYNGTSIFFRGGGGGGMTYAATGAGAAGAGGGGGGGGYGTYPGGVGGLSGFNLGNTGGSSIAGFGGNAGPNTGGGGGATCQDVAVST